MNVNDKGNTLRLNCGGEIITAHTKSNALYRSRKELDRIVYSVSKNRDLMAGQSSSHIFTSLRLQCDGKQFMVSIFHRSSRWYSRRAFEKNDKRIQGTEFVDIPFRKLSRVVQGLTVSQWRGLRKFHSSLLHTNHIQMQKEIIRIR